MKRFWILTLLVFTTSSVGCDYQNRYSDSGVETSKVQEYIAGLDGQPGSSSISSVDSFKTLSAEAEIVHFMAWDRAEQYMGPMEAVAPLDFAKLGASFHYTELTMLRTYLFRDFDGVNPDTLVFEYSTAAEGSTQLLVFEGSGYMEEGVYYIDMTGNGVTFRAYSYDTLSDDLDNDIQLKFSDGSDYDFGQVSNLEGIL